jgi:hypothetical protein
MDIGRILTTKGVFCVNAVVFAVPANPLHLIIFTA